MDLENWYGAVLDATAIGWRCAVAGKSLEETLEYVGETLLAALEGAATAPDLKVLPSTKEKRKEG